MGVVAGCGGPALSGGRGPLAMLLSWVSEDAMACRGLGALEAGAAPRPTSAGGSGGEPLAGAPPRQRPAAPGPAVGATGTPPLWSSPPGGRCATLTGITPPSTTPPPVSPNSRLTHTRTPGNSNCSSNSRAPIPKDPPALPSISTQSSHATLSQLFCRSHTHQHHIKFHSTNYYFSPFFIIIIFMTILPYPLFMKSSFEIRTVIIGRD